MIAKIATKFEYPEIILLSLIKIAGCRLKIAIRHPKISGLKIAVHSLKIAGLKIIARVYACVYVRGCVGAWVRSHFAEVSKIAQDAPRAGTQAPERPPNTRTQATTTSTRAGAPAGTQRTRIAKEIKKTIANKFFFNFLRSTFAP